MNKTVDDLINSSFKVGDYFVFDGKLGGKEVVRLTSYYGTNNWCCSMEEFYPYKDRIYRTHEIFWLFEDDLHLVNNEWVTWFYGA